MIGKKRLSPGAEQALLWIKDNPKASEEELREILQVMEQNVAYSLGSRIIGRLKGSEHYHYNFRGSDPNQIVLTRGAVVKIIETETGATVKDA
jgi:hypothetical protein